MKNKSAAYNYLIRLISKRDYSQFKLEEKLRLKGHSAEEIKDAIDEVAKQNYLREENYVEARIKGLMHKHYSMNYIQNRLKEEHLSTDISTIANIFREYQVSESYQITYLINKKTASTDLKTLSYDERFKLKGKLLRFLISKGHDYSISKEQIEAKF